MFYYLTGHRTSALDKSVGTAREAFRVGLLVQPFTKDYLRHDVARHYDCCGVDNGCFTKTGQARFSLPEYERIAKIAHYEFGENLYFVTAEDVRFTFTRHLNIKDQPFQYISHVEAVKVACIRDRTFFEWIESHADALARFEPGPMPISW